MEENLICGNCITENYLQNLIQQEEIHTCSYCSVKAECISIEDIVTRVIEALDKHFYVTNSEPEPWQEMLMRDKEETYDWFRDGTPLEELLIDILETTDEIVQDILQLLPDQSQYEDFCEARHDADTHYDYAISKDPLWEENWKELEQSIKSESRYFNPVANKVLDDVFSSIEQLITNDNEPAISTIGPNQKLNKVFRARELYDLDSVNKVLKSPDSELGPPPFKVASAGRMNPRGISVFYSALEKQTAISEIRPAVGSYVVVGEFDIIRKLKVVDIAALQKITTDWGGSCFDPEFYETQQQSQFLVTLSRKLSQPIHPHESELEYITTQLVAEYLSQRWDGLLFESSQIENSNKNLVLFHKSSRVEELTKPKKGKIDVRFSDHEGYFSPEISELSIEEAPEESSLENNFDNFITDIDPREPTLRIDDMNLSLEKITGVEYMAKSHKVYKYKHSFKKGEIEL